MVERQDFIDRLVQLRMKKGVSAREMSLSIGQSPGYINNIESGVNYPTMQSFFYICEYLNVSPQEFFDTKTESPVKVKELVKAVQGLRDEQMDHLIAIVRELPR